MISFHTTLLRMGRFRLGISKRFSGIALFFVSLFALVFYTMYWMLLAGLWMLYGAFLICIVLPYHIIRFLNRDRNDAVLEANKVPKILRSDLVFWLSVLLFPPLAIFILFLRDDKHLWNRILCGICALPFALGWISIILSVFK